MTSSKLITFAILSLCLQLSNGFTLSTLAPTRMQNEATSFTRLHARKEKIDLSSIESRDLTREEMLEINKQNEEVMNMELQMMTIFSVVLSLPIFYLCWVAFYSE